MASFEIAVNGKNIHLETKKDSLLVDTLPIEWDIQQINDHHFHALFENNSYNLELVSFNKEDKVATVKVNGREYVLKAKDQYDLLLHKLGMDNLTTQKAQDLKAPMPGLVLKVLVKEGDEIKKGDNLLVLEAMKMENIIKASADAKVKAIKVKATDKVEKNQLLIAFA